MLSMTRLFLTGLILVVALVPVAPLLLVAFVVIVAAGAVLVLTALRRTRSTSAPAQRLALYSVGSFRGPPAALAHL